MVFIMSAEMVDLMISYNNKAAAEEEIRVGLEIFHEIGIKPNVFVPPAWKLNNSSIEVLQKLGFDLA